MSEYKIKKLCRLTKVQRSEIRELVHQCRVHDNIQSEPYLSTELNYNRLYRSFFLCYFENELIGFIGLYMPEEGSVEVSAYTRPDKRRQRVFSCLNECVRNELRHNGISEMIYVHEPLSIDGKAAIRAMGLSLDYAEYLLEYRPDVYYDDSRQSVGIEAEAGNLYRNNNSIIDIREKNRTTVQEQTQLCEVSEEDRSKILPLMAEMEQTTEAETEAWFDSIMQTENTKIYKFIKNGKLIGAVNISEDCESICIFGVVIEYNWRGRGYGGELVRDMVNQLKERKKRIVLHVSSKNKPAFNIYVNNGFIITQELDYYTIKL